MRALPVPGLDVVGVAAMGVGGLLFLLAPSELVMKSNGCSVIGMHPGASDESLALPHRPSVLWEGKWAGGELNDGRGWLC